jgi:hypothetical protein
LEQGDLSAALHRDLSIHHEGGGDILGLSLERSPEHASGSRQKQHGDSPRERKGLEHNSNFRLRKLIFLPDSYDFTSLALNMQGK